MSRGTYNIVVYLGSGERGRLRRVRWEREARANGYINKKGKVKLAPFIIDRTEGTLKEKEPALKS